MNGTLYQLSYRLINTATFKIIQNVKDFLYNSFMSATGKIASNTFYQLLAKGISVFSTVVATALITRGMGISSFGTFFLMTGFATYFFLLVDFGINTIATRETAHDKSQIPQLFNSILALRLTYSVVLVIFLTLILPLIPFKLGDLPTLRLGIFIGLLAIISQAVYNTCTIVFQSTLNYQKTLIGSFIGNLVFLFLAIIIIFNSKNVLLLVTANTIGTIIVSLVAYYLVKSFVGKVSLNFDYKLWRRLVISALPLGITMFLTVIVSKADSFLLSVLNLPASLHMSNADALGNYGLAYKIFENILVFPTFFVNALFPVMVIHRKEGSNKLKETLIKSLGAMVIISVIIGIIGYYFSPLAIFVLSGQGEASAAVLALRLLILGLPFFFCSAVLLFFLITEGLERQLPWVYGVAAVFNVVSNVAFIPRYGFTASAILTGITEFLIFVLLLFISIFHLRRVSYHEKV